MFITIVELALGYGLGAKIACLPLQLLVNTPHAFGVRVCVWGRVSDGDDTSV